MNFCQNNERYWIDALNALEQGISSTEKEVNQLSINPKEVQVRVGFRVFHLTAPFKSGIRESFGKMSGLILINGQAHIISTQGKIIRRSTLSRGVINAIDNIANIPNIQVSWIELLMVSHISDSSMETFYRGERTVKGKYYQYSSLLNYLYIKASSDENLKDTIDRLLCDWVNSIPSGKFDDAILHEFLKYKGTFSLMLNAILLRIINEPLPITEKTLINLSTEYTDPITYEQASILINQLLNKTSPNQQIWTPYSNEKLFYWNKVINYYLKQV